MTQTTEGLKVVIRELMSELANNSATIEDTKVLDMIAEFVGDSDGWLVQIAAQCLIICGEDVGISKLKEAVNVQIHHYKTVLGIAKLCGVQLGGEIDDSIDDQPSS